MFVWAKELEQISGVLRNRSPTAVRSILVQLVVVDNSIPREAEPSSLACLRTGRSELDSLPAAAAAVAEEATARGQCSKPCHFVRELPFQMWLCLEGRRQQSESCIAVGQIQVPSLGLVVHRRLVGVDNSRLAVVEGMSDMLPGMVGMVERESHARGCSRVVSLPERDKMVGEHGRMDPGR